MAWTDDANCVGEDPSLFYPQLGNQHTVIKAKKICKPCTVRSKCLADALRRRERYGIWGMMTVSEREGFLYRLRHTG